MKQLIEIQDHRLPRCGLPANWKEGLHAGLFFDGSGEAANARIFLKSDIETKYFCGAVRLADLGPQAAAKTECKAMLLVLKMASVLDQLFKRLCIPILSWLMFGDSEIALSSVCSVTAQMKLFYAARYRASQDIIKRLNVKIFKVDGSQNDADIGSKMNVITNFALEQEYWHSKWFHLPQEKWPVEEYNFEPSHLHLASYNPKFLVAFTKVAPTIPTFLDKLMEKFQSWRKVRLILAYILFWKNDWRNALENAETYLLSISQPSQEQLKSVEKKFQIERRNTEKGIILLGLCRPYFVSTSKQSGTSFDSLKLVDGNSAMGRKLLRDHHLHCASPAHEQARLHEDGYFVIGSHKYFKDLQKKCLTCIRIRKQAVICQMGPSLQPALARAKAPPLAVSMIDVFGPIKSRLTRNTTKKLWILTTSCIWSRFTSFQLMSDLTANSVLQSLRTQSLRLGGAVPQIIYSDHGTNILPIHSINNADEKEELSIKDLKLVLRKNGTELRVSSPSAPWRQGLVDSMHKVLKATFRRAQIFKHRLNISEWEHVLANSEYMLNSRPINLLFSGLMTSLVILTPNKLMCGSKTDLNNPINHDETGSNCLNLFIN